MAKVRSSPPIGVMAGGRGLRLTGGTSTKPLYQVGGKALIDYVLDSAQMAQLTEIYVLLRSDDVDLLEHLDAALARLPGIRTVIADSEGTGRATTQLMAAIGERDHVLTTCDVICRPHDLSELVQAGQRRLSSSTDLALLALTTRHGIDLPIWVDVDSAMVVTGYGKHIAPTNYSWGNIRYSTARFSRLAGEYNDVPNLRDTTMVTDLVERFPGTFHGIEMAHLFDVDTPTEASWLVNGPT